MIARTLKRRDGAPIDKASIAAFKGELHGQALQPGEDGYDKARRIWNASIDKYPGLIVRCANVADVVRAVNFARDYDLLVAIKSGGHNVAGRALCDDGIVIDLSAMNGVMVDPLLRTVRVQAGALLCDVDRATHQHGLAVPTGVVSKTGIAGLTLGGGIGWLARKHGLTCDNLLSCDVVTAEGDVITANDTINPDLFWGLRGGGGNFGIVTSFLYQAHPVSSVMGGLILYPRDQAAAVLRFYRYFMAAAPEELTAYAGLLSTPDGTPAVGIMACYCGDLTEGERILKPLRAFGSPFYAAMEPMPFPAMQTLADPPILDDTHNYWRSAFLKELSDEAIDLIVAQADLARSPLSHTIVQMFGGAIGRIGTGDTAYAQRQATYNIGIEAQWTDPVESKTHIAWTRDFSEALKPYSTAGLFLNFIGDEGPDVIRAAFGDNHARLVKLKTKYDPTNFFSLNQNVEPRR